MAATGAATDVEAGAASSGAAAVAVAVEEEQDDSKGWEEMTMEEEVEWIAARFAQSEEEGEGGGGCEEDEEEGVRWTVATEQEEGAQVDAASTRASAASTRPAPLPFTRGIWFGTERAEVEQFAAVAKAGGLRSAFYHAGLPQKQRVAVQTAFATGCLDMVCATKAWGMGMDDGAVDFVLID